MRVPASLKRWEFDALLAAGLALSALVQVLLVPIAAGPLGVVIALGSTLPVAWRRSRPATAAALGTLPWLIPSHGYLAVGYIVAFVLFYSAARYEPDIRLSVAAVVLGLAVAIAGAAEQHALAVEYLGAIGAVVTPAFAGWVVRRSLERERQRAAAAALFAERTRIARELHDVVAHGLSVIAIQADAAASALDRRPELAQAPVERIRRTAADALVEMRQMLQVLRVQGEPAALAPQPGIAQLPALLEASHEVGQVVALKEAGRAQPVPAGLGVTVYRVVQEALTNARRHAPGASTEVSLEWLSNTLELWIRTRSAAGAAPVHQNGAGHGLIGIRERVRLHGGEVEAGPDPHGGWNVHARLPIREGR